MFGITRIVLLAKRYLPARIQGSSPARLTGKTGNWISQKAFTKIKNYQSKSIRAKKLWDGKIQWHVY